MKDLSFASSVTKLYIINNYHGRYYSAVDSLKCSMFCMYVGICVSKINREVEIKNKLLDEEEN